MECAKSHLEFGDGVWRTWEKTAHARHSRVDQRQQPQCCARFTEPPGNQIPSSLQLYTVVMSARPRPPREAPQAQPLLRTGHLQYEGHSHPRPEPSPLSNTPSSQDHPPAQLLHRDCLPWSPSPIPHCEDRRQGTRSQRQGLLGTTTSSLLCSCRF